jgi:hypothetical protein
MLHCPICGLGLIRLLSARWLRGRKMLLPLLLLRLLLLILLALLLRLLLSILLWLALVRSRRDLLLWP